MGSLYTAVAVSNYNSNPPSDDGSQTAANRVQWSTQKIKLTDPIKTAFDTSETNTATAFAKTLGAAGITSTGTNYTVASSDQGKLVNATASSITITTPDATSVNSPFTFFLVNTSSGNITFSGNNPGVQQTIDGLTSITVPAGNGLICQTDGSNWFTAGQNFTRSFAPPSAFKNLSIKVTGNTGATLAADFITVTTGSKYQTLAFNQAINMATTGAGGLDTGSIASATWYAVWAIAKEDGTTSAIASTSSSAPTMPTGYTYKARVGWLRTAAGVAQLMGTWQLGKEVQYVLGLAQTTSNIPLIASGAQGSGSSTTPTFSAASVSSFVPSTASRINLILWNGYNAGSLTEMMVAPNGNYGGPVSSVNNPPWTYLTSSAREVLYSSMMLESTNIYLWGTAAAVGSSWYCGGWVDNI